MSIDGSILELHQSGPADAPGLLVFHVGTPSAATAEPALAAAAARHGLRMVSYSRPGYGRSERRPGRTIGDEAARTAAVADLLGYRRFVVLGWSGGGPVALACAALLPERVGAALAMASMTPSREVGPAWRDWQQPGLTEEFDAIAAGEVAGLIPDYDASIRTFGRMTPRRLAALAVAETERQAALAPDGIGVPLARSMRRAALAGSGGWLDDAIAEASDWGFRVGDIRVPVVVRHGELDRLVPIPNGRWLAGAIPGAIGDFRPDRGHSSIALPWTDVVDSLVSAAGSRLFGDRATT